MHLIEPPLDVFDEEGNEFPSLDDARAAAVDAIRDILAADIQAGKPIQLERWIEISDNSGSILAQITFRDAVQFDTPPVVH